ncbi:MAG: protoheme IX farnesyltransferase [Alphaproteobacteria bacterium]|nr:protoheme IX farnesyltransferase [Alphaproteobacteria bacterium]
MSRPSSVSRPDASATTVARDGVAVALDGVEGPAGSISGDSAAEARDPGFLRDLLSLTKPRLSSLVLFTAGGGLALAPAPVDATRALAAIGGTTLVVAGANVLNCYLERESDRGMARTAVRPLPRNRLDARVALVFGLALSAASVALLTLVTPPLAGLLAAIALVLYVCVYTPMKRTSSLSVLVGAIPGAMPPVIGWVAATGRLDVGALVLFGILFMWQVPHSLAIGLYRKDEYTRAGLVVHAAEHGDEASRRQILLYTLGLFPLPLLLVRMGLAGLPTAVVGSALGGVLLYQAFEGIRSEGGAKWARKLFLWTLVYMTGLFAALGLDVWL